MYSGPSIIPHLWYPDTDAAIAFLERAFGFELYFTAPEHGGGVHAELRAGRGFVMLGPAHVPKFGFRTPREIGNVNTGAVYIALPDVGGLYLRAKEAGADIVRELHDTEYGSRDFSARDPHGYLWNFGTYQPAAADPAAPAVAAGDADVYDALRYDKARAAIEWLTRAFGFDPHHVAAGGGDEVQHALLRFGRSLLIVSSARPGDPLEMKPPHRAGGVHTQVAYCVVADPDRHCAQAQAAGAEILLGPVDIPPDAQAHAPPGARLYMARDPEGYLWCFSTYGPAPQPSTRAQQG